MCVFKFVCLRPKTFMVNKKHNLKSGKNKDNRKGFERENKTENPRERERIDYNKNFVIEYFDVVIFH